MTMLDSMIWPYSDGDLTKTKRTKTLFYTTSLTLTKIIAGATGGYHFRMGKSGLPATRRVNKR